jgi:DNA-binding protein HU-beta
MKKLDLIQTVMDTTGVSAASANRAVSEMLNQMSAALDNGESVTLVGFGTFIVQERSARSARNPRSGETVEVGPKKVVKFKAGKALRAKLNA